MKFNPTIRRSAAWAAVLVLCVGASVAADTPRYDPEYEARVGREVAAEVDRSYERVDNPETLEKLQNMADVIGANTPRPQVQYDVRLVREKQPGPKPEVNAFSLPGGIIYITEGLLDAVHSDHELAGVMAHEIAHNVTYDGLVQAERANRIIRGELAAILATILVGGIESDAWGHVMQAGMFYRHGVLGGYSIEMERAADIAAVRYLMGTPWDPVGLLTFMERLAAEERRSPPREMGIFKTHPLSVDRVSYLIRTLQDRGVTINRRRTAQWDRPQVEEREVNGKPAQVVVFQGQVVFACPEPADEPAQARERAERIAAALTEALAEGAQAFHFAPGKRDGRPALLAGGDPLFVVNETDAALLGKTPEEVVKNAHTALRAAFSREALARMYGG